VKDNDDGTYTFSFVPTHEGEHELSVSCEGHQIQNSPFLIPVRPSRKDATAANSYANGRGISAAELHKKARFTINPRNFEDSAVLVRGNVFEAHAKGPGGEHVPVHIEDIEDEIHTAEFTLSKPGSWKLHVFVVAGNEKKEIQGSPYNITVEGEIDLSSIKVRGFSAQDLASRPIVENQTAKGHIEIPQGQDGAHLADVASRLSFELKGPEGHTPVHISEGPDGKHDISFLPTHSGSYSLHAKFDGQDLVGSPFDFSAEEGLDETETVVLSHTFTVQAKTKKGNNGWHSDSKFDVSIAGPQGNVEATILDEGEGKHRVSYSLPASGKYTVSVLLNGKHIKGSPWEQTA